MTFKKWLDNLTDRMEEIVIEQERASGIHTSWAKLSVYANVLAIIGACVFTYSSNGMLFTEMMLNRETAQKIVREACESVTGCKKAGVRVAYDAEAGEWRKYLWVSGKNVNAADVLSLLEKKKVPQPVFAWVLRDIVAAQ